MLARALSLRGFRRIQRNRSVLENHVQRIVVRTGRELYPQLKLKWPKLYKNIPPEGLRLEVDFLDTKQHHRMFDKIVLAIHGTPGDYRTYSKLCEHYLGSNVRVVVPNLPDFSHTRRQNFWHSIEEKACFIEDFLKKISVGTVHCLVGHSYGFHTVAGLLEQCSTVNFKSVALFSPYTSLNIAPEEHVNFRKLYRFQSPMWYSMLRVAGFHRRYMFVPMKMETIDDLLWLKASTFDDTIPHNTRDRLEKLAQTDKPLVIAHGAREKIIPKETQLLLNQILQIPDDEVIHFDSSIDSLDDLKLLHSKNSIIVNDCGHYLHHKQSLVAKKLIDELLDQVS